MTAFYGFIVGMVLGAPIFIMCGVDLERSRRRRGGGW